MPGEQFTNPCFCVPINGGVSPTIQPYVVAVNSLSGIVTLAALGGITITSAGNTIYFSVAGEAGLGTVTSVQAVSSNSNLTITGSPITTLGTFTFDLAGNLDSISGLVMAADQMLYSTGVDTFAATSMPAFGRTLVANASAADARVDLGLVIGTNVQAWNAELDRFVTDFSNSLSDWTLTGTLTVDGDFTANGAVSFPDVVTIGDTLGVTNGITSGGTIIGVLFDGSGASLTNLNASNLSGGPISVAIGGTGFASYTVGDILYASGATTLAKLADVAAGSFLRSGGVTTAPVWSTTLWPNTLTTGDILYASSATQVSRLANVATGNVLLSGGVGVASAFGKVTTAHTTGIAASGANADITSLTALSSVTSEVGFTQPVGFSSDVRDGSFSSGATGDIFTSTGVGGTAWSSQISLSTLNISSSFSISGTITTPGTTGNQTINKPSGSVNIVAGGSSITVTNSLVTANTIVTCAIATNDTTAILKNVVASSGQFVIRTTAAVTAETKITFVLFEPS